ncbi:hypothetical protein F5Y03DRAFT_353005 [Xylaria venustula]|nr:hypothetical protein F5Y03DRAFT_353005 [Xylaria venustula]
MATYQLCGQRIYELVWLYYYFDKYMSLCTGQLAVFDNDEFRLTLPPGYTALGDMLFSPSQNRVTFYSSDLTLTKFESKVFSTLCSRDGMAKSDPQPLADVYGLDVKLEDWRLIIYEPVRPSISEHIATAMLGLEPNEKMLVTFIYLSTSFCWR